MNKRETASDRLHALMADGRWHHMAALNRITFRYGARFWDWKQDGEIVEKRRVGEDEWEYRLVVENRQGVLI